MSEEFKKNAKIALVALVAAIWLGIMVLAPDIEHDPAWTSGKASEDLTAARNELCATLYASGKCPRVGDTAKYRIIRTVIIAASDAPGLETVATLLTDKGWVLTDTRDANRTVFCRSGYSAAYTIGEERVWVEFSSGEAVCLR